jgi:hypothetical protein
MIGYNTRRVLKSGVLVSCYYILFWLLYRKGHECYLLEEAIVIIFIILIFVIVLIIRMFLLSIIFPCCSSCSGKVTSAKSEREI